MVQSLAAEQLATNDIWLTVLVNNARDVANLRMDSDGTNVACGWQGEFALGVVVPYELTLALASVSGSRPVRNQHRIDVRHHGAEPSAL